MSNFLNRNSTRYVGKYGESAACIYLKKWGFSILSQNLRLSLGDKRGEIDILAIKDNTLYVVEVKTACSSDCGHLGVWPEVNLSKAKIRTLHNLRNILLFRMFESGKEGVLGEISMKINSYRQSLNFGRLKTVILGVVVDIIVDKTKGVIFRDQISRIRVRVFPDL